LSLQAPFPYFGGKSRIAPLVWSRFGDVRNYVEPFFGSGATLLMRPEPWSGIETVNDACGYVANFWRAVAAAPDEVAYHADWPVNENDLHARHSWLVEQRESLHQRLEGDPDWFDAKVAGWWCWGMCCWIGSGFCSGRGPWHRVESEPGVWTLQNTAEPGKGVSRQRVHLGDSGRGVSRQRVHLGDSGRGVSRQLVHLGDSGRGVNEWMAALSTRLARVRVCCGDWSRVCGLSVMRGNVGGPIKHAEFTVAVFLDPPYADTAKRDLDLYRVDSESVAHAVREWALERGDDPRYRIALCGYDGEHVMSDSWECVAWQAGGGMGRENTRGMSNRHRERVWFSPHCVRPTNGHTVDADTFRLEAAT
jgi:hypothetical protein